MPIPSYNLDYSIAVLSFWDEKLDLFDILGTDCNADLTGGGTGLKHSRDD